MKTMCILTSLTLLVAGNFGCSLLNPPGEPSWGEINRSVERFTELAARVAFVRDDVKPHKANICIAVKKILPLLETYEDSGATFDHLRSYVFEVIKDLPDEILNPEAKSICVLVIDQVLDIVFRYAKDSYVDLINQDEARMAITISRAVANGLNNACRDTSLQSFSVEKG